MQLYDLAHPEHAALKPQIPYNLQFSTDAHAQRAVALAKHGPIGHKNHETQRSFVQMSCFMRALAPLRGHRSRCGEEGASMPCESYDFPILRAIASHRGS